jgi:hypothetical protein
MFGFMPTAYGATNPPVLDKSYRSTTKPPSTCSVRTSSDGVTPAKALKSTEQHHPGEHLGRQADVLLELGDQVPAAAPCFASQGADRQLPARSDDPLPHPQDLVRRRAGGPHPRGDLTVEDVESPGPRRRVVQLHRQAARIRAEEIVEPDATIGQVEQGAAEKQAGAEQREVDLNAGRRGRLDQDVGIIGAAGKAPEVVPPLGRARIEQADRVAEADDDRHLVGGQLTAPDGHGAMVVPADVAGDVRSQPLIRPRGHHLPEAMLVTEDLVRPHRCIIQPMRAVDRPGGFGFLRSDSGPLERASPVDRLVGERDRFALAVSG